MLSHVTIGVRDVMAAQIFYDDVLAPLGYRRLTSVEAGAGYARVDDRPRVSPMVLPLDGRPASPGNGVHIALLAPDRAAVDAFHARALAAGGSNAGGPGLRAHYHPHYHAACIRDRDANKIQAECHQPSPA